MTGKLSTDQLLAALDELDLREGGVVAALLARAEELRRRSALTAADLAELKQRLSGLATVVDGVQTAIDRAGASAPPALEQLKAQLDANAVEFDRLRAELRSSVVVLEGQNGASHDVARGRTFRLLPHHMKGTDVAHFQRVLNVRLARWGVHRHVAESGDYDAATRLAAHEVALGLGIETAAFEHGITPEVRDLIQTPSHRTPEQIARAHQRRAKAKAVAKPKATAKPKAVAKPHAPAPTDGGLAAAIRAHGGHFEDLIIAEAHRSKVPVSLVCAVMEAESSFTNVFGHDDVANTIKSIAGRPNLVVTEARYKEYKRQRDVLHRGNQGVGPMQLTATFLQDRADALGGCFKVGPNIRTGVERLGALLRQHHGSVFDALVGYNGKTAYAKKVAPMVKTWHARLMGHASAPAGHPSAPPIHQAGAPRTFRLTKPDLMHGADVKAFQQVLNHRFAAWGIGIRVAEDGVYGMDTRHAAHQVALGLGLAPAEYAHGITPAVRTLLRKPSRRTAQQRQRAASRRDWLAKLRKREKGASGTYPLGVRGTLIGTPFAGTHTLGNWQSDNAVDLGVPIGTAMIAVDSGSVVKVSPHPQDGSRFAGDAITIVGDHGNSFFYKHGVSSVKVGQRVHKGQKIGTSGSASGVAHLHFGVKHDDPRNLINQHH